MEIRTVILLMSNDVHRAKLFCQNMTEYACIGFCEENVDVISGILGERGAIRLGLKNETSFSSELN